MFLTSSLADADPEKASVVFDGCSNRARVAAYIGAMALEQRVKGIVIGTVVGVAGALAVSLYLRSRSPAR